MEPDPGGRVARRVPAGGRLCVLQEEKTGETINQSHTFAGCACRAHWRVCARPLSGGRKRGRAGKRGRLSHSGGETSIAALTWTRGETTISLRKSGDTWYVEGDEEYPLDQNAVEALVQSLASLTAHMRLEGVEAPEDYGLTEPALAAAVELANGETRALFMGDEALLGGEYYLGTGEEGVVYVTDVALSSILSASVAELTQWEEIPRLESVARLVILGPNASLDQSYFADSSADVQPRLALVPDGDAIPFRRGRHAPFAR